MNKLPFVFTHFALILKMAFAMAGANFFVIDLIFISSYFAFFPSPCPIKSDILVVEVSTSPTEDFLATMSFNGEKKLQFAITAVQNGVLRE